MGSKKPNDRIDGILDSLNIIHQRLDIMGGREVPETSETDDPPEFEIQIRILDNRGFFGRRRFEVHSESVKTHSGIAYTTLKEVSRLMEKRVGSKVESPVFSYLDMLAATGELNYGEVSE